ncbi:MAG: hypothetical protein NC115_05165 [Bacteroidales bacterium]|nr:hypothetical protein [Bacteroidales bacterium]
MKALPSIAFNEFRRSAKDVTARVHNGRQVLSARAMHSHIKTRSQAVSRNRLATISRAYKRLEDPQMKAWAALAEHLKGISTFGSPAEMTAHNAFVRINTNRILAGMPMLTDAPAYINDVPEVEYDDFRITPDVIVFTGLKHPSDNHVLVFKISPAQSPGVTSGFGNTVIITSDMVPDWGDAELTNLYTSVIRLAPEEGKKYFCEFWWMDKTTGFTGESMWVSAICKSGSTAYEAEYVPRARVTMNEVTTSEGYSELDIEVSEGSAIVSVDAVYSNDTGVASGEFIIDHVIENLPLKNAYVLGRCDDMEGDERLKPCSFEIWFRVWRGQTEGTLAHRGGSYESEHVEVFGTGPMY